MTLDIITPQSDALGLYAVNLFFTSLGSAYPVVGPAGFDHILMVRCGIVGRHTDRGSRLRVDLWIWRCVDTGELQRLNYAYEVLLRLS